nr:hypothetical protein [uncultured Clostridium sp.]
MEHEFYCRARRYFKDDFYEAWSLEFDYGNGYSAEDKMILEWCNNKPRVLCLINSRERMKSEEYTSIILGLFEDITEGEESFELKRIFDLNVDEYDIEDLINKHTLIYDSNRTGIGTP